MRISIPTPCHENWNDMNPEQQGAFCKVCSKVVVDFSAMSDEEVINYLEQKKEEKTCGRFRTNQLSPYELKVNLRPITHRPGIKLLFAAALFVTFSSFFSCTNAKGDTVVFNRYVADMADTATVTLMADTTAVADSILNDFIENSTITTRTTVGELEMLVVDDITIDTTMIPLTDTIAVAPPPDIIMGAVAYPMPEFTKGKVMCTDTTAITQPVKKKKQPKNKRGDKGPQMGELHY